MKYLESVLSSDWAYALGWTLLHSLWQSLLILVLVIAFLRSVPAMSSGLRYALACGGLFLFIGSVALTFIYSLDPIPHTPVSTGPAAGIFTGSLDTGEKNVLQRLASFVDGNMWVILSLWITGVLFSVVRLSGEVYLTSRLRATAIPLENEWNNYIREVSRELGIRRIVRLASSAAIHTPLVIGCLKPLILVPVGLFTGLTTEQIETILVHELAHIRRHDYIVNFIQSLVGAVFFFNPFLSKLSDLIRREREYCCDDLVLTRHGGARAYARALAQLAEARLLSPDIVLPLSGRKHHLLNRIIRIMEKSVRSNPASAPSDAIPGKARVLVPVALMVAGLICVSWLGIDPEGSYQDDPAHARQDTLKKQKGAHYSRRSIITLDENGQPREEVVEEFEGDEELRPLLQKGFPDVPDVSVLPPGMPDILVNPPLPHLDIHVVPADTIPRGVLPFRNHEEWEALSRDIQEEMKRALDRMSALGEGEGFRFMEELKEELERGWQKPQFHLPFQDLEDSTVFRNLERELERLRGELPRLQQQLERLEEFEIPRLKELEQSLRLREDNFHRFESAVREELMKDGYLSEGETIESLEWNADSFRVNGKAVREGDRQRYLDLHEKFLGGQKGLRKLE